MKIAGKRLQAFMSFLINLSSLSKCCDKQNAAILCDEQMTQIYSIGLNGGPKHGMNCLCQLGGKYTCVHAEAQALMKAPAPDHGPTWSMMLCTMSPCVTCASMIINYGVHTVVYCQPYKDDTGIRLLLDASRCVYEYVGNGTVYEIKLGADNQLHKSLINP